MGKEENKRRNCSFWSFFGFFNSDYFILRRKNFRFDSRGFSLIEFLIAFSAIIVLAAFALNIINPLNRIKTVNDEKRKNDLVLIRQTLERYYKGNRIYPKHSKTDPIYRLVRLDDSIADWGEAFVPYLEKLPKDPKSSNYVYFSAPNGQSYFLYASLEREEDSQVCNKGKACESLSSNGINVDACGGICNYGVSSSNVTP